MPIPVNVNPPVRMTAKETAYNQILQWIIDGTLLPGEKINDTELAEALGVSRTPVRESLQLLESQGFVKMYPGKATQVTEVDRNSISELLPPLAAMQSLAVELAIPNMTEEDFELLTAKNEQLAKAVQLKHAHSALRIDEDFHQIIIKKANNQYVSRIVESLQAHVRRLFFHNSIFITEQSIDEHKQIISLMRRKQAKKAAEVMKTNWLRAIEEFYAKEKEMRQKPSSGEKVEV